MKPDYRNWVPKSMIYEFAAAAVVSLILLVVFGATDMVLKGLPRTVCAIAFSALTIVLILATAWMAKMYAAFDYNGSRKLSKVIVEGTAEYVHIPDGGHGLDVGCGSGALTIACAKRNPKAHMTGCDIWSGPYKIDFTMARCMDNAKAEGVSNVSFEEGNAISLPFPDESFDAVTSNYVYHNIPGHNKQDLLLETLRVLKKGGTFAIHDLMSKARYGNMDAFVKKLKEAGYEDVRLIDTADGKFIDKKEARWLDLGGSTLLVGKK